MKSFREAWAEIDLNALRHNLKVIRTKAKKEVKLLIAVKTDAYGHGMLEVSKVLEKEGVDYLGVATVDEGLTLRKSGIKIPILVFTSVLPGEVGGILKGDLIPTICTITSAAALNKKSRGCITPIHIKIDTGMGRIGVWCEEALNFIRKIQSFKSLRIEGIYTHFATADEEDTTFTHLQLNRFRRLLCLLTSVGIHIPLKHAANSMGLFRFSASHFNLVRLGLVAYGLKYTKVSSGAQKRLRPVLSVKSRINFLKEVPKGKNIGYGRTFITGKKTTIATIPIGYGDGYSRALSNKAAVLVRGKRAPVVGRVCMDQLMADVGNINGVRLADKVVIVGKQGNSCITIEELAEIGRTVPQEIACSLGNSRLRRVYIKENSNIKNQYAK